MLITKMKKRQRRIATMEINWTLKKFDDLTPAELYAIMQLRNEVFVVEQNCVYQDADDKDAKKLSFYGLA